ncbi:hypothetical protein DEA8626_01392 [Defluviimonas aquaemixtae]|uniref:Hedgehog/Intein (Hint) domain-containing protein n=1 Tax=Albidovulum aquaemixtae TaxID=1542388 RepID=A0A2R8B5K0_9RHOB|nr:Hint domain-containing protein [Defluviimonas aquaemixtae]SPH17865.1 hypothetical protein DEA8626_01392 [Defluviimonas aquaemixtae]
MSETTAAAMTDDAILADAAALRFVFADEDERSGRVEMLDGDDRIARRDEINTLSRSIPCFTPGTHLATPQGEVPADTVRPGDRLITRDNGAQKVLWCGRVCYGWRALGLNPLLRPVRFASGSLGNGLPERDLTVSPNHRMLLRQENAEMLVPAADLVGRPGIGRITPREVTYLQIFLPRHEAVLSDGVWSESFEAAPGDISRLSESDRTALAEVAPERSAAEALRPAAAAGALESIRP